MSIDAPRRQGTEGTNRWSGIVAILGLTVAYLVVARLGLLLALPPEKKATAVWPASGLALAALLLLGVRVWPGVWLGAFLANLWDYFAAPSEAPLATHLGVSFGIALGSTLQALAGATLLRWFAPHGSVLDSARHVFRFVGIALSVCLIAATFGTASLGLCGLAPSSALVAIWWTWWLGDVTGILLVTPLLVAWKGGQQTVLQQGSSRECALMLALTTGVALVVFGGSGILVGNSPLAYLTVPLLVWAAVRFGPRGATTSLMLVAGLAVWGTASGHGPFVRPVLNESLLLLQVFMAVVAMTTLVLGGLLTEREHGAEALRASEELHRLLTEALPHMVWTMRPDATVEFANRRATEFLGRTPEELNARGWGDLIHPEDRMVTRSVMAGALKRGEAFEVEYRVRHHTSEYRWVVSRGVPLKDGANQVVKWIGSSYDTHDRRTAEDSLRMSERRYRALVQTTAQMVWRMREGESGLSDWWRELTGQTAESLADWGWLEAVHPDDRERARTAWSRAYETLSLYEVEYRVRVRSGEYRYFAVRGVALCDPSGRLEEWVGTLTDVHDKKLTEEGLRQLNATLEQRVVERTRAFEESERRFGAIFHAQYQFIGLMDPDGTLVEANRTALAAAGVSQEAVLGKLFWETPWWTHDAAQQDRLRDATRRAATGESVRFEASHPTPDGALIWVDFSLTPFRDAAGRVVLLIPEGRDITERKRAEAALREKTIVLETILDSMGDAVLVTGRAGEILLRNRAFHQLHETPTGPRDLDQWPREFGLYLPGTTKLCPVDRLPLVRALRGEPTDDIELDIVSEQHPHGLATSTTGRPLTGPEGVTGGVIVVRDVSSRKRADAALRLSEERFRSAFDSAPIGMALVAPDGRWLRVNRSLCEIVGYTEEELLATDFQTITHPDDLNSDLNSVLQVLAGTTQAYQMEKRYFHKQGHVVHVLLAVSLVRDLAGQPLYFISQLQDITRRKQTEQALREREELFRLLLEGVTDYAVVFLLDTEGRVTSWNSGAARITGYEADEILGKHFSSFYPPEVAASGHPQFELASALSTGHYSEEGHRVRKDGSHFWASVALTALRDPTGRHIGFVKVTRDMTERKATEERMAASLREKEVLLKEIHHRVKNNLQIISTLLDLQSGYTTDRHALEMFQESRGRVRSMALIHERLYRAHDIARVNFAEYIRQLADNLYHSYRLSDDEIRLALDIDIPPLPIDIAIPCGLLLNELMSNCFKHAFTGRDEGEIRVSLGRDAADPRTNVLVVSDNGRGFPNGLDFRNTLSFGLQLVNTLVDQLDGVLALTADRGTTFTVRFPQPSTDRLKGPLS